VPRRPAGQHGAAPLEAVLTFPLFIFFVLAIIQGCMWYVAQEVAQSAAQQGARTGAEYQSTPGDGVNEAWNFIDQTNNAKLLSAQVTANGSDANEVTITVTGNGPSVLPFWPGPPIVASVQMPVEQLTSGNTW
jgi:Flp pilus assembly protein TadG